jgi:hypothetical protein
VIGASWSAGVEEFDSCQPPPHFLQDFGEFQGLSHALSPGPRGVARSVASTSAQVLAHRTPRSYPSNAERRFLPWTERLHRASRRTLFSAPAAVAALSWTSSWTPTSPAACSPASASPPSLRRMRPPVLHRRPSSPGMTPRSLAMSAAPTDPTPVGMDSSALTSPKRRQLHTRRASDLNAPAPSALAGWPPAAAVPDLCDQLTATRRRTGRSS